MASSRSPAVKRILQVRRWERESTKEEADTECGESGEPRTLSPLHAHSHYCSHNLPWQQEIREIEKEGGTEVVAEALEVSGWREREEKPWGHLSRSQPHEILSFSHSFRSLSHTRAPSLTTTTRSQDDIFEWMFAIRGAPGTDFAGGIYMGRISLPPEYPLKPPSFSMLTRSGRFATGTKICLSISQFHEELWSPSWSVRTALVALAAFMPTPGGGAIGALDWAPAERRALAAASRAAPPEAGGGAGRQAVVDRLHARLVAAAAADVKEEGGVEKEVEVDVAAPAAEEEEEASAGASATTTTPAAADAEAPAAPPPSPPAALRQRAVVAAAPASAAASPRTPTTPPPSHTGADWEDTLLAAAAALCACVVAALLMRSAIRLWGGSGAAAAGAASSWVV